ncbi:MAG: PrsW family intramembrane metalloprotease, partial [Flavobacteriales bacterium]|nr:PrsW family intramembrane metalloprotease [Flavobacteriales bacterium]
TAWLRGATGMALTGDLWDDLVYSVVAIGLVEEVVKLLPYLLIWRLTRQVDEPFDHLLYGSIAALGFAFMENTLYLESTRLTAVTGRALLASVAHMFDTSI